MFEKQYRDEDKSFKIDVPDMREELACFCKSVDVAVEAMTGNPGEWLVRSPYARYRFVKVYSTQEQS